jgi:hypothetical protein
MNVRFSLMQKPIIVVLSFLVAAAASAQQYKWIDKDGKVRYGDTPPPGVTANRMKPPSGPVAPAPSPEANKQAKPLSPEAAFRKRQEDADKEREKQTKTDQDAQTKRENCARAQDALRTLETGQRVARTDTKGERYFLDDGQVAQETARARQSVQQWCN